MHPVQLPQIVPGAVLVGALAIQKHAVPGVQLVPGTLVLQLTGAALHPEKQVGRQPLAGAGVGLPRLQTAHLLQMDEVRPRKRGGRVDHAPGMYQLAVKKWCFHDALLPKFLAGIIPQQHTKSQYNATALQDYPYSNRKKSATITNKA